MARRPKRQREAGDRERYETISFRLPGGQSERLNRFRSLNRLNVDEVVSFLFNQLNVNGEGTSRMMIDYAKYEPVWKEAAQAGYEDHSMRIPASEAARFKTFKTTNRLAYSEVVMFLLDEAGIAPDGESVFWINYQTLTVRPFPKAAVQAA